MLGGNCILIVDKKQIRHEQPCCTVQYLMYQAEDERLCILRLVKREDFNSCVLKACSNEANIGCNMLASFEHNVGRCWMMLA